MTHLIIRAIIGLPHSVLIAIPPITKSLLGHLHSINLNVPVAMQVTLISENMIIRQIYFLLILIPTGLRTVAVAVTLVAKIEALNIVLVVVAGNLYL